MSDGRNISYFLNRECCTVPVHSPVRADRLLKAAYPHLSGAEINDLFRSAMVCHNNTVIKKGTLLSDGIIEVQLCQSQQTGTLIPNPDLPLSIIYEDDHLLAVNKQPFCHTVAQRYDQYDTLANRVAAHCTEQKPLTPVLDGGSCNRLDFETSGLVLFAKSQFVLENIRKQFQTTHVVKEYLTCTAPPVPVPLLAEDPSLYPKKSSPQRSEIVPLHSSKTWSILLCTLITGERHQLRRQLASRGYPIRGDKYYGGVAADHLFLHALYLELIHPLNNNSLCLFAPLPAYWEPHLHQCTHA